MYTKCKYAIPLFVLLVCNLAACGPRIKFVAPEIEPPADLIPGYVPEGVKLVSGFKLAGKLTLPAFSNDTGTGLFNRLREGLPLFEIKSPNGNDILGVYYQGKGHLVLIASSYFPEGTLDLWWAAYEAAQFKPNECECTGLPRLEALVFPARMYAFQEERTIDGTRIAILEGPLGWITVFVRSDHLLSVESDISLEENLKIVTSLLAG